MEILIKMVGVLGAVMTIKGLFGVFTGAMDFFSGRKNDNPTKVDSGVESMITGGAMAAISAGIVAAIVVSINTIKF